MRGAGGADDTAAFTVLLSPMGRSGAKGEYRQWCRRLKNVNALVQIGHCFAAASGCHSGTVMSASLLALLLPLPPPISFLRGGESG